MDAMGTALKSKCTTLRYVRHERSADYLRLGWVVVDDLAGTPHGQWSCLMKWPHDGPGAIPTETVLLLSSPKNASRLRSALAQANAGKLIERDLDE